MNRLTILVIGIAFLAVTAMGISLYEVTTASHHTQKIMRDDLCGVLRSLIVPGQPPPTTEHGKIVARALKDSNRRIGC